MCSRRPPSIGAETKAFLLLLPPYYLWKLTVLLAIMSQLCVQLLVRDCQHHGGFAVLVRGAMQPAASQAGCGEHSPVAAAIGEKVLL